MVNLSWIDLLRTDHLYLPIITWNISSWNITCFVLQCESCWISSIDGWFFMAMIDYYRVGWLTTLPLGYCKRKYCCGPKKVDICSPYLPMRVGLSTWICFGRFDVHCWYLKVMDLAGSGCKWRFFSCWKLLLFPKASVWLSAKTQCQPSSEELNCWYVQLVPAGTS